MSNQLPSTSDATNCSVTGNNNAAGFKPIKTFKWTKELEICLLQNMTLLKPCGINKHLSMLLLKKKIHKEFKLKIPITVLWNYVSAKWDIRAADLIEDIPFDTSEKDFVLPEDFEQLIDEEGKKIKNLNEDCLNDEINERKLLIWSGKTRSRSNSSMSSVDSKEVLNEMIPSTLLESSPTKTNEVGPDDDTRDTCTRSSLCTNDKFENSKFDEKNKLKDLKQSNKIISNKSKCIEKIEKIPNIRQRKTKSRSVSESSFSSDNSKQRRNYKNNLTDFTISDSLSRSVFPDIPKNPYASLMEIKPEKLMHSKNEANNKVKAKICNRVTSDLSIVQQSVDNIQLLGRRSCSNKNS